MGLFDNKKGLIIGVANDRSIAWAIASYIMQHGGQCGFTHLPDRAGDDRQKNRRRVSKLTDPEESAIFLESMDANNDDDIARVMKVTAEKFGKIDFLLHSIAFAPLEDLKNDTIKTSREGFKMAMEVSAYSLIAIANAAQDVLDDGAAILTMTYFGGEKAVPGYNIMGICKAALDSAVKYLAYDLGPRGIRVNALSAGPIRTLAGVGAGVNEMLSLYEQMSPMQRNVTTAEVGKSGAFLLSDMSSGVSGDILHIDGGYHAMGSPGRLLDHYKADK